MIGAATLSLFVYCFFGKLATTSFEEMANCTYESNWQQLRVDLQTYLILMIGNMQRPIYYHGFGVAVLNLETFCKVTEIFFSILRRILSNNISRYCGQLPLTSWCSKLLHPIEGPTRKRLTCDKNFYILSQFKPRMLWCSSLFTVNDVCSQLRLRFLLFVAQIVSMHDVMLHLHIFTIAHFCIALHGIYLQRIVSCQVKDVLDLQTRRI